MKKFFGQKRIESALLLVILILMNFPGALTLKADDEEYGVAAYRYLQIIDANYPSRVTDQKWEDDSTKNAAGKWIRETLESFGNLTIEEIHYDHEGKEVISYIATKKGNSERILSIGAHYDSVLTEEGIPTKGVEDNGTGVSLLLELAGRFANTETYYTLEFCFFDGEETQGLAGSYSYLEKRDLDLIVSYINIDCVGAGDYPYAYGGEYEGETLVRDWTYNMAKEIGYKNGIVLFTIPESERYGKPPVRTKNSDQYYFNKFGIPYVYFEANCWVNEEGEFPKKIIQFYNSNLPAFSSTGGQIIHTVENEDLKTLEEKVPGRIQEHLTTFSIVISEMIRQMDDESPEQYKTLIVHEKEEETKTGIKETSDRETKESKEESEEIAPTEKGEEREIPSTEKEESTKRTTEEKEIPEVTAEEKESSAGKTEEAGEPEESKEETKSQKEFKIGKLLEKLETIWKDEEKKTVFILWILSGVLMITIGIIQIVKNRKRGKKG